MEKGEGERLKSKREEINWNPPARAMRRFPRDENERKEREHGQSQRVWRPDLLPTTSWVCHRPRLYTLQSTYVLIFSMVVFLYLKYKSSFLFYFKYSGNAFSDVLNSYFKLIYVISMVISSEYKKDSVIFLLFYILVFE